MRIGRKKIVTCLCAVWLLLTGCGQNSVLQETVIPAKTERESMLESAELLYEVTQMVPHIMVDLVGYEKGSTKQALLFGSYLPKEYEIIDVNSGESVYCGEVKTKECVEDTEEEFSATIDFTDFDEPGTYYIKTEILGQSKKFRIQEGLYDSLVKESFMGLHNLRSMLMSYTPLESNPSVQLNVSGGWVTSEDEERDVVEGSLAVMDLLIAYEYFPQVFTDDFGISESGNGIPDILDEAKYEILWLVRMQNPDTGGVYASVSHQNPGTDKETDVVVGETTKATAYFCATLARFSYLTRKFDPDFATDCFAYASKAWKCLEANRELVQSEQMFYAAVEMYRATGSEAYRTVILNYLKDSADKDFDTRISLDAAISYMASTRNVNLEYCTSLMAHYMSRTEDKSNASKKSRYLVEPGELTDGELMRNAVEVCIVDYIISNKEYATIEENYLHYFCGRNFKSRVCDTLSFSPDAYAQFLVVAGKTAALYKGVEE